MPRNAGPINFQRRTTDTVGMARTDSQKRGLGVDRIILRNPTAATNNLWQVEICKTPGARGCFDALNASFAPHHQQIAENYARRMMRILQTDHLDRAA